MPDRYVADQRKQHVLGEHLGDQALVAIAMMLPPAEAGRDPGRFLPSVLESEQREVGEPGDVGSGA